MCHSAANKPMRASHARMPLILSPKQFDDWLDPENPDPERVLTAIPQEELELVPMSDWVNNVRHDDPRCLDPR
jgi:putative SOS response-associated peptidase YedK